MSARPDYLLFTEALRNASGQLMWRMLLLEAGSDRTITASDVLEEGTANRAELLALVRGLEALDGPANVRLFSGSGYVTRGVSRALPQWRAQSWHWERFGRRVPIRDHDLWQRVDRALEFHSVECRAWGEPAQTGGEAVAEPAEVATSPTPNNSAVLIDDPAILVVPKRRRPRRRSRLAAATRNTLGRIRQSVEPFIEPALLPTG